MSGWRKPFIKTLKIELYVILVALMAQDYNDL